MKCPLCGLELKQDFYKTKINFKCTECDGRIMTLSGLRALCGDRKFTDILWEAACYGYSKQGIRCPGCGEPMRKVTLPLCGTAIELDLCCSCQLIWFDPHELDRIPPLPEKIKEELPQKAKEILAMRMIEKEEQRISTVFRQSGNDAGENEPDSLWKYIPALLGMPVETDTPECTRKPFITWGTALLCLIVFAVSSMNLPEAVKDWGFIPAEWARHGGITFLTSMFLHSGILHLLCNLYFLLIFGDNVEDEFGHSKYTFLILASGISALLLHWVFDPGSSIPCIGASGFISGIIACYMICFPKVKLSFLICRRFPFALSFVTMNRAWYSIPAWCFFGFWLLLQIVMATQSRESGGGGIAYFAHIGGFLPGIVFALYHRFRQRKIQE